MINKNSKSLFSRSFLPSYHQNAVVHLILATGVCFIAFFFVAVCFQAFAHYQYPVAVTEILGYVGLPSLKAFSGKVWTLLTYGLFHTSFMNWVGTAIWIYLWGNVLQLMAGYRQVIPVFVGGNILGGLVVLAVQALPGVMAPSFLVGSQAGIMALAAAAFAFSPGYRFWITPTFSLSIKVVLGIFILLNYFGGVPGITGLAWMAGGALAGVLYVVSMKKGYRIGDRIYKAFGLMSEARMPAARPKSVVGRREIVLNSTDRKGSKGATRVLRPQERIDALLEKIHAKGYKALSEEERDFLKKAGENS